ncbi:MAG TPA: polysaccharide deacetylase family protein [Arachnia sp.]|nr:polysaccharide deacetylase family protein [Arachnia sp.]
MLTKSDADRKRGRLRVVAALLAVSLVGFGAAAPAWATPSPVSQPAAGVALPRDTSSPKVTASSAGTKQVGLVSNAWGSITGFPGPATISTQVLVNGKWSTSQQAKNITSGYTLPLTYGANTPGTNRWRVVATDGTRTATSPEFTFTRTPAPPKPSGPYSVSKGANTSDRVVLTYDDCPKSLKAFKDTVLAAEEAGVGLGLFPTGDCLKAGRFDADFAREHGMHVFNHSISHPDLTTLSQAGAQKELGAPGVVTTYGRPPYGAYNDTVKAAYAAVGMKIWTWTVDTNDWRGKSQSDLVSYVTSTAKAGDTVLMHMQWNAFNGTAIRDMKKGLEAKGLKVCRNYDGTVPVKPADMWC